MVAFVFPVLWLEVDLYFQSSKLDGVIWQVFAVIPNLDRTRSSLCSGWGTRLKAGLSGAQNQSHMQ
jgi:hypothetical protein